MTQKTADTPMEPLLTHGISHDPEEKQILTFGKVFEMAGGNGWYQKRLVYFLSVQRIFIGYLLLCFPFIFKDPIFQCKDAEGDEWEFCRPTPENCERIIEPHADSENSLVLEFGLYCNQRHLIALCQSLFLATTVIGMFAFATTPDTKGRKLSLMYSNYASAGLLIGCVLIKNVYFVLGMIGMWGLAVGPNITYTFMYLNEVSDSECRQTGTVIINAVRSVGQMFLGILCAWIANDWRLLILLYLGLPWLISIYFLQLWTDEPPGFLVSQGKYQEAKHVIMKIGEINGNKIKDFIFYEEIEKRIASAHPLRKLPAGSIRPAGSMRPAASPNTRSLIGSIRQSIKVLQRAKRYNYPDLIKYNSLKMQVVYLTIVLVVEFFYTNALTWAIPSIEAPTSWVTFAISLGELLSCLFGAYLYVKLKRRALYFLCHLLLVASCLPFAVLDAPIECQIGETTCWQSYMQVFLTMVSKCVVSIVVMLYYIYAAEVFPTPVRALGTGLVNVLARAASIFSPMIIDYWVEEGLNPMTMMGLMGIPAVVVCLKLKETKGQPLMDEIEEEKVYEMKLMESTR